MNREFFVSENLVDNTDFLNELERVKTDLQNGDNYGGDLALAMDLSDNLIVIETVLKEEIGSSSEFDIKKILDRLRSIFGGFRLKQNRLFLLAFLIFTACTTKTEPVDKSEIKPDVVSSPVPTLSVINEYIEAVREDNEARIKQFTDDATEDYSGLGYGACVVDSDCLAGVESCVPGTVPNTPQMPGFCIGK